MDESTIIAIAVTAFIIQCIVFWLIINDSTWTQGKIKFKEVKIPLLVSIAKKLESSKR